jgi:hypothetical protein
MAQSSNSSLNTTTGLPIGFFAFPFTLFLPSPWPLSSSFNHAEKWTLT